MSVLATIEPANLQVDAGAEASLVVRVRNRGSIVDQFDISVVGPTAKWASVDPPSLRLFPDKEGEARVTFRPPRAADPAADTYPFGVAVRAASDASASTVEEGRIEVAPFVQLASEIVPQTSRGSRSASHDLTITNVGNSVAEVSVKASDPDRLLNFVVAPERMGLRPGASSTLRAVVKPKTTFWLGSPKRVPFSIQIDEPTAGSYQVPATLEQRAIIPGWVRPAGGLLIAAIVAVMVLPRMLGIDLAGAGQSPVVVVSPTPEITLTPSEAPTAITEPPTAEPTEEIFGPPDTLVAAGDQSGLSDVMGLSFKCPKGDACRDDIKARIQQILANLGGNADGAQLAKFTTTVAGTLPIVATWDNRYKYAVGGTDFFAKDVAIDLAPKLGGKPAYAYIKDTNGTLHWYTIPDTTADLLLHEMYNLPAPAPTTDPGSGGGVVFYHDFYTSAVYNGLLLQTIQFAATPPP
jgi:hypothetical protein